MKKQKTVKSACRTNKSNGKFTSAGVMFKFMGNGFNQTSMLQLNNMSNKRSFNGSSIEDGSFVNGTIMNYSNNDTNELEENQSLSKIIQNVPYTPKGLENNILSNSRPRL